MFKFENKKLSYNNTVIDSSITTLELVSDIDATIIGILQLSNKEILSISFTKVSDKYKGLLKLPKDLLPYLNKATFKIILLNTNFEHTSNLVTLKFNLNALKLNITQTISNEIEELRKDLQQLALKLDNALNKNVLKDITIKNTDYIKKGMVLTALDDKGNFIAEYPFNNLPEKINGQEAINGVVNIDASMIKYNSDRTVETILTQLIETVKSLNEFAKVLSSNYLDLQNNINVLTLKLEQHLNDGII